MIVVHLLDQILFKYEIEKRRWETVIIVENSNFFFLIRGEVAVVQSCDLQTRKTVRMTQKRDSLNSDECSKWFWMLTWMVAGGDEVVSVNLRNFQ